MHRPGPMSPPTFLLRQASPFIWATLGYLALALYGSLVPFHFRMVSLRQATTRFRAIPYYQLGIESRSDWVANILLFIPLGFLVMAALCIGRRRVASLIVGPFVVVVCVVLSVGIEFTQIYFPPRTVSLNDVVAESLGGLLGTLVWLIGGQQIVDWARGLRAALVARGQAARVLPGYLLFLVLVHVMPLDLTISPVEVYCRFQAGHVRLIPFDRSEIDMAVLIQKDLWNAAFFLPLGLLLARMPVGGWVGWRGGIYAFGAGLGTAATVEFLQLFVYTRVCDATDVITGGLAVVVGWVAGRAGPWAPSRAARAALLAAWVGILIAVHWQPFDFIADPVSTLRRLRAVSPIPFADYYWGTEYEAFDQVLHKALLFLPIGVLLTSGRLAAGPGRGRRSATLAGLVLATGLEAGQLFLPSRFASVTDVLVGGLGAWLGSCLAAQRYDTIRDGSDSDRREP